MEEDAAGAAGSMEDPGFSAFAPPSPHWLATAYSDVHYLPYWNGTEESAEHTKAILDFRVNRCPEFQKCACAKRGGRGKDMQCFDFHFESQRRRCPVDLNTCQLLYWDAPCQAWSSAMGFCPNGDACLFAHGFEEVSYHPAKYKTRSCNGRDCRGEGACCFAHGDGELRRWAPECYAYLSIVGPVLGLSGAGGCGGMGGTGRRGGGSGAGGGAAAAPQLKHRFCASYPNVSQCRRGAACAFAHSREEVNTPLLSEAEEEHDPASLTEPFFTGKFKTLWCPIGAQHDWQSCVYAHTYQDARRKPSIGYGPQPCPYWSKKDTRAAYSQRCPLGLRCPYSHGAKEQLYHPKYFRTVICRDMQQRGCPRQHLCAFHHKRAERRVVGADTVDYSKPLEKQAIPTEWATHFLAPPFFQDTCEADPSSMPMSFPSAAAAPGAWGVGMPMGMGDDKSCWGMPADASADATAGPEESPRTQSTSAEDKGEGAGAADGYAAGSEQSMPFYFGGGGADGAAFQGFPVFAGAMMPMQQFWWPASETEPMA